MGTASVVWVSCGLMRSSSDPWLTFGDEKMGVSLSLRRLIFGWIWEPFCILGVSRSAIFSIGTRDLGEVIVLDTELGGVSCFQRYCTIRFDW